MASISGCAVEGGDADPAVGPSAAVLTPPLGGAYTASRAVTDPEMGMAVADPTPAALAAAARAIRQGNDTGSGGGSGSIGGGGDQCVGDCYLDNAGHAQCAQVYTGPVGSPPPAAMHWRTGCQNVLQWIADSNLSAENVWVCTASGCSPRKIYKDAVNIGLHETGSENQTLGNFMNPGPTVVGAPQYCESQNLNLIQAQDNSTCDPWQWRNGGSLYECQHAGLAVPAWSKMTGAKSSKHPVEQTNNGVMCAANMTWAIGGGIAGGMAGGAAGVIATIGGVVASLPSCAAFLAGSGDGGPYWAPVGQDGAISAPGQNVVGRTTLSMSGFSIGTYVYGQRNIEYKACHRSVHHEWGWLIHAYMCPYVVNDQGDATTIDPECGDADRAGGSITAYSSGVYFTLHEKVESEHTEKCQCHSAFQYGLPSDADCGKIYGDVAATITSDTFKQCVPSPPGNGSGSGSGSGGGSGSGSGS